MCPGAGIVPACATGGVQAPPGGAAFYDLCTSSRHGVQEPLLAVRATHPSPLPEGEGAQVVDASISHFQLDRPLAVGSENNPWGRRGWGPWWRGRWNRIVVPRSRGYAWHLIPFSVHTLNIRHVIP